MNCSLVSSWTPAAIHPAVSCGPLTAQLPRLYRDRPLAFFTGADGLASASRDGPTARSLDIRRSATHIEWCRRRERWRRQVEPLHELSRHRTARRVIALHQSICTSDKITATMIPHSLHNLSYKVSPDRLRRCVTLSHSKPASAYVRRV